MPTPSPDPAAPSFPPRKPLRLLIVLPSWLGDAVMATPALALLRKNLPGSFIGGLMRPGLDELLAGSSFLDEMHVDRARGVMGPKLAASKIRPRRYDTAVLLTNSFSTALITRLAFIPRRVGYDRDARGLLLTDRLKPDRTGPLASLGLGSFTCISAVNYYLRAARAVLGDDAAALPAPPMHLGLTPEQSAAGAAILTRAGITPSTRFAILNPGANNPAKRWPPERFAAIAAHLIARHHLRVLINGGPAETELADSVAREAIRLGADPAAIVPLPPLGTTIGSLKHLIAAAALLVTNDTGPRHIAAATGTPVITLYGPTDPRWTILPVPPEMDVKIVADPTLPADLLADDHPDRCRIDRIEVPTVQAAVDAVLATRPK